MLKILSLSLFLALIVGADLREVVQQKNVEEISEITRELRSTDWATRDRAIGRLKRGGIKITDELRNALLNVLIREAEENNRIRWRFRETGEPAGEGHGEYVRNFLDVAVPLTDERSAPYLVQFMDYGDDVIQRLIALGRPAFEPVLEKLEDSDSNLRERAVRVLAVWLKGKDADFLLSHEKENVKSKLIEKALQDTTPEVRMSAIKALGEAVGPSTQDLFFDYVFRGLHDAKPWLREKALQILAGWVKGKALKSNKRDAVKRESIQVALDDPIPYVRIAAVGLLAETGDFEVIPVLEKIAKEDIANWKDAAGKTIYPVREAAIQTLRRLRMK